MSTLIRSTAVGLAAGLRSTITPAVVSWAAATSRLELPRSTRLLADPRVTTILCLGALGEIVVDKLPFVPSRTVPPVLTWRIATGAFLGALIAAAEGESAPLGGLAGSAGAAAGAYGGVAVRTTLGRLPGISEPFPGIAGDVLAFGLSLWSVEE